MLVLATKGELGEYPPGFLDDGETLTERRVAEQDVAAKIIGVDRVAYLGYHDSGMDGEDTNDAAHRSHRPISTKRPAGSPTFSGRKTPPS